MIGSVKNKVYRATRFFSYEHGMLHIAVLFALLLIAVVGSSLTENDAYRVIWCIPFVSAGVMSCLYVWATSGEDSVEDILDTVLDAAKNEKYKSGE